MLPVTRLAHPERSRRLPRADPEFASGRAVAHVAAEMGVKPVRRIAAAWCRVVGLHRGCGRQRSTRLQRRGPADHERSWCGCGGPTARRAGERRILKRAAAFFARQKLQNEAAVQDLATDSDSHASTVAYRVLLRVSTSGYCERADAEHRPPVPSPTQRCGGYRGDPPIPADRRAAWVSS